MPELWGRYGCGQAEHHCVVIDTDGKRRLPRRVANDENALLNLIADVLALSEGEPVAMDLNAGGAALLTDNGQKVLPSPRHGSWPRAAWTWPRTARGRSTGCGPRCWSTSPRWSGPSTTRPRRRPWSC